MRRSYRLSHSNEKMFSEIQATLQTRIPPYKLTIFQTLYDRHRVKSFNCNPLPKEFGHAIQDFLIMRGRRMPTRKVRAITSNAWKQDPAVHRRIRELRSPSSEKWRSLYRGQPERYDPEVVRAFGDVILRITGRKQLARGHIDRGHMVIVLAAAITWAVTWAWILGGVDSAPPRPASRLGVLKIMRGR